MLIEWDEGKALANRRKHRVNFSEAMTVFNDPLALTVPDPDHSSSERRFITIGESSAGRVLIISHTCRGAVIRLISARRPTRNERSHYEKAG
ncbi:MAG: BrnT family toxin [Rubrivivax sp.]|nr:BrnT family toxin [Pyrinomonadaceae bacterium]